MDHSPPPEHSERKRDNTDPQQRLLPGWRRWQELLPLLLIVALGLAAYANTFSVRAQILDPEDPYLTEVLENLTDETTQPGRR
ncbi:MAG: hypothetical protein U1D97_08430 [Desulfuromonadales bacterium]|nr:hypothetical protein [Desulfuromonadales bacterium]